MKRSRISTPSTDRRTHAHGPIATAALLMLLLAGPVGSNSELTDVNPSSPACHAAERETILALVREHQRAAGDDWHNTLTDAIYDTSLAEQVDPLLVASIVARESSFRTRVVSHMGAVGLMQLRPFVAQDVSSKSDVEWIGVETLHQPELNVRLGILYYKELVDRFDGDTATALTAYNRGPTRVSRQLRSGTYQGSRYAERILELYDELKTQRDRSVSRT